MRSCPTLDVSRPITHVFWHFGPLRTNGRMLRVKVATSATTGVGSITMQEEAW